MDQVTQSQVSSGTDIEPTFSSLVQMGQKIPWCPGMCSSSLNKIKHRF